MTVEAELTLQNIIENAQAKYDAAVDGNKDGLYAAGSKAQLQSAIVAASATANDSNATPEQVNHAKAVIQLFDKQPDQAD
ncbi:hypothetical protein MUG84_07205 [Paenibacillus sp. KQZ6P-2]|uniref:DUF3813 domain-containing protein n=1 Tax=Paenibacillus mangrovi TaxID=2931978 RepID=A0A9X2B1R4_9BACL|nr:hypothetical protein [Paenibacillus mangrovi]MCJ8011536.1 hypothetical protein [Paenibacillus mangrovi]